ncbi:ATP-binding protein [Reticulibacter mediterranei]|uniref:ATP-binding protein n=1 Tax=Reticulibacter mediterranei TaxID=2778369 RepID=A0A8J3IU73_9CHLR|nr:ATP-binding protein [Reticulibacter mediterranei]GHO96286.1 ATP-binding protein [Reticulibacter mediterranei]
MSKPDESQAEGDNLPVDRKKYAVMTKDERLQEFKRTVAHPHLKAADQSLREAIREPGGASLILVYGPARVGKTTMKNHVIKEIITEMLPALQEDREQIPIVSILPRPPMNNSFSWKDFLQSALIALEEPLIDHKVLLNTGNGEGEMEATWSAKTRRRTPEGTKDALRVSFETAIRRRRPRAVIIDEAQHLGKVSGGRQLQNQLDCIKSLADITETVHVLIGTYELLPLRNLSAQLIGRSLDIHFPRYHTTKKELSQFKNILGTFQQRLPFAEETDVLLKNWEFCYERSIGCLGNLRLMLIRAVRAAMEANEKTLSLKLLEKHAFSEAELFEMMVEAHEGEKELAAKPEQHTKLREMLGLYPTGEGKPETSSETQQNQSTPLPNQEAKYLEVAQTNGNKSETREKVADEVSKVSKKAKSRISQPGRRNPKRDRTGQVIPSPENKSV